MFTELQILIFLFVHFHLQLFDVLLNEIEGAEIRLSLNLVKNPRNHFLFPVQLYRFDLFHVFPKVVQHIVFNQRNLICSDFTNEIPKIIFSMRMTNFIFEFLLYFPRKKCLFNQLHGFGMTLHVLGRDVLN